MLTARDLKSRCQVFVRGDREQLFSSHPFREIHKRCRFYYLLSLRLGIIKQAVQHYYPKRASK